MQTWHDALGMSVQMLLPVALCELFTLRHRAFSSCLLQQLLPNLFQFLNVQPAEAGMAFLNQGVCISRQEMQRSGEE